MTFHTSHGKITDASAGHQVEKKFRTSSFHFVPLCHYVPLLFERRCACCFRLPSSSAFTRAASCCFAISRSFGVKILTSFNNPLIGMHIKSSYVQ